jgi:hypothetical protein
MSLSSRKIRPSLVLGAALVLASSAGVAQLNPTVKVLPRANGTVPADCDQGLAPTPATPRIVVSEIPQPAPAATSEAPPSGRLRSLLRNTQNAAEAGNRAEFRAHLDDLRAMVAGYPRGGERDAAAAAVSVYDDLDTLWTYAFEAPTGAFFDATTNDGALLRTLNKYPEYGRFIARQTVTAGGTTLYPTTESRQFLVREAARRASLTSRSTTPAPRTSSATPAPTTRTPAAAPRHPSIASGPTTRTASASTTPPAPHRTHSTGATHSTRATHSSHTASTSKPRSTPPPPAPAPAPTPVPVRASAPPPAPLPTATSTPVPAPAPVTPTATTSTTAPTETTVSTDTTLTTASDTAATDTTATTASATETTATTDTTATTAPAPAAEGRNLVIPVVLILIGLGVLILLFRASS